MTNKEKNFLSYMAGILDGDGSIFIEKTSKGLYRLGINIQMSDWIVPLLFYDYFGGELFYVKTRNDSHMKRIKPILQWYIKGNEAFKVLKALKPFLVGRIEQCVLGISFQSYHRKKNAKLYRNGKFGGKNYYSEKTLKRFGRYKQKMKNLNHSASKGTNLENTWKHQSFRQFQAKLEDFNSLRERLETKVRDLKNHYLNKPISIPEQDIVRTLQ